MEPSGSPFRRPPARAAFPAPRRRFGPVPAAPLTASMRSDPAPRPLARGRIAARPRAARARRHGAAAFYVVAALALVGALLPLTGHDPHVVIGLGVSRFTDGLATGAFAHAALVGGFALLGGFAQRGRLWAFAVGGAAYALDGLLVLAWHDWVAVAIHTAVLAMLARGLDASRGPS